MEDLRRFVPPRRPLTNRYQNIFFGYYFSYNNFVHKSINCIAYARSDNVRNKNIVPYETLKDVYENKKTRSAHGLADKNYNSFVHLLYYNNKFYILVFII